MPINRGPSLPGAIHPPHAEAGKEVVCWTLIEEREEAHDRVTRDLIYARLLVRELLYDRAAGR